MESHQAIRKSCGSHTVEVARALHLSTTTIHKWSEASSDFTDSGALNPLDRLEALVRTSRVHGVDESAAIAPLTWLASRLGYRVLPMDVRPVADSGVLFWRMAAAYSDLCRLVASFGPDSPAQRCQRESAALAMREALDSYIGALESRS